MAWPPILVRFGEIGIKSRSVRGQFERRLESRIEEQLVRRGVEAEIKREDGRILVRASDVERALDALTHTFGVVSASPAIDCEATPEGVAAIALEIARERLLPGQSFAMKARRAGQHTFTSLDVAKATAEAITTQLADRHPRVDLNTPDLSLHSEIRGRSAYVYTRNLRGPGGLPLGSQGKVCVIVDGPHAAHAAWLAGKRGSSLVFLTAHPEEAPAWLEPLTPWIGEPRLFQIEPTPEAIREQLERHNCHALVRAEDAHGAIAQFEEDQKIGFPVFRPLVGYSGERFRAFAKLAELPEA